MGARIVSDADKEVKKCLESGQSFALIAGAGSGKTTSLIDALLLIRAEKGAALRRDGQHIACITYTRRAVEVIKSRLGFDDLYLVSTLHSFLWGELRKFQHDIRAGTYRQPYSCADCKGERKGQWRKQQTGAKRQTACSGLGGAISTAWCDYLLQI